jgi:hypothetical protein
MLLIVFTTYKFTVQFQSSANAAKRKKLERMYRKLSQELKESGGSEKEKRQGSDASSSSDDDFENKDCNL